ncbi:DUF3575 domain-containing protein [Wenyingzhuangia sp. IMCC45533]
MILFVGLDLTYEKILNDDTSLGVGFNYLLSDDNSDSKYELTGYYRNYFSTKFNQGFFVELFAQYAKKECDLYFFDFSNGNNDNKKLDAETFSPGIAIGGKWVTKKGIIGEIFLGVGRNILEVEEEINGIRVDVSSDEIIVRAGISIGKRF